MLRAAAVVRLALAAILPCSASAAPITYTFTGTVSSVSDPANQFGGSLVVGVSEVEGSFTIDDSEFSAIHNFGCLGTTCRSAYDFDGAAYGFNANFGGIQFQTDPQPGGAVESSVGIVDRIPGLLPPGNQDLWAVEAKGVVEPPGFTAPLQLSVSFGFNVDWVYTDTGFELPPSLNQALAFDGIAIARLARTGGGLDVVAQLTSFSAPDNPNVPSSPPPIPEPSTAALLTLGLCALAAMRRRSG